MKEEQKKLLEQLDALKLFPNNKLVKQLRKQIIDKLKNLEKKKPEKPKPRPTKSRSGKLRRYHNYIRQIRNNFPDLSYNQIRTQLKKRKEGNEVDIPDAVWQNPSP